MNRIKQFAHQHASTLAISAILCMLLSVPAYLYSASADRAKGLACALTEQAFVAERVEIRNKVSGRILFARFHGQDGSPLSFVLTEGDPGFDELARVEPDQTVRFCERVGLKGYRERLFRTGYVRVCPI